jgi:hypothetical protein
MKILLFFLSVSVMVLSLYGEEHGLSKPVPKNVYLSLVEKPETFYTRSVVAMRYKLLVLMENYRDIRTSFNHHRGIEILNPNASWVPLDESVFYVTYYYKILDSNATFPDVTASVFMNKQDYEDDTLQHASMSPITLNRPPLYSGVLAQTMNLLNHRSTPYDKEFNLLVFEMKAKLGNLKDFQLSNIQKQGIESIQNNLPESTMIYYAIMPKQKEFFVFKYFNLVTRSFQTIQIPNLAKEERVSTQSDIRPKKTFQLSQILIVSFVIIVSLILFFLKRNLFYFLILCASIFYFVVLVLPQKEVVLKSGTPVSILPSRYSTNYVQSSSAQRVVVLEERKPYLKIQLIDGKIGWVKEQYVQ